MNYLFSSINEILKICNAEFVAETNAATPISQIVTDSRHIANNENMLFVTIKGLNHNGHDFLKEVYEKGIRNFLVSELPAETKDFKNCNILKTTDTVKALQEIAATYRNKFDIPVLAITGSNGKTMVKEWLYQLLSSDYNIVRSPKSYNSQIGVPLSIFNLSSSNNFAIFEAGISLRGEMEKLEKIISPTAGIITNVGTAHDENFSNHIEKANEKIKLFKNCKKIIYCQDHDVIHNSIKANITNKDIELFSWGHSESAWLKIIKEETIENSTKITACRNNENIDILIPFTDKASIEDIIHCWTFLLSEKYDNNLIKSRIKNLSSIEMRLDVKEGKSKCTIINDSYNSDINSLSIAIDFLEKNKAYKRKTIILSDILQSGKNSEEITSEIAQMIEKRGISRFIGIGENLFANSKKFNDKAIFFKTTYDFLNNFDFSSFHDEMILLKGARKFGFEHISMLLEDKAHETTLEIDLNALTNNINFFKSKLKPNTLTMAMVKAFAYGSGSIEIARHLEYHRINYLAVAYADEGVTLRNAGITLPIMVASPEENNYFLIFRYKLEPEIYSINTILKLIENIEKHKAHITFPIKIHVKFDSGMHRLGFTEENTNELLKILKKYEDKIKVASTFSHFTSSDDANETEYSEIQLNRFNNFAKSFEEKLGYKIIKHIANSAGTLRFPEAHLDMIRLGIGLYGIDTTNIFSKDLIPIATLKSKILQIKNIASGETVGYSRKAYSDKPRKTATIAIGYADGFLRIMGNGNWSVFINGKKAPIIGNVCMDMCIADVTEIENIKEGDTVEIFGENNSIYEYAKAMNTIPYEALTSISERVKRIYIQKD